MGFAEDFGPCLFLWQILDLIIDIQIEVTKSWSFNLKQYSKLHVCLSICALVTLQFSSNSCSLITKQNS